MKTLINLDINTEVKFRPSATYIFESFININKYTSLLFSHLLVVGSIVQHRYGGTKCIV